MIAQPSTRKTRRRPGLGLIEMAMTGVLIAAAMAATLQVIGWVALDRRAVERRERAVFEAANLMERIQARPWNELTTENLASTRLNASTASFLPGSKLTVKVESSEITPAGKKLTVEVRWLDRSGRLEAPVRLVAWTYAKGGAGQ